MPYEEKVSEYYGWNLRHNSRTVWKNFYDAGLDLFAIGPANNTQAFLQLYNILPSMNGGFTRRWGLNHLTASQSYAGNAITRTFVYQNPQDNSDLVNTATTNIIIGTDDEHFYTFNDDGTTFTGHGPTNFGALGGLVDAVTSRGWFYYTAGLGTSRKVNPSYTTANTDSLMGIALPVNVSPPPSTEVVSSYSDLQNQASVWSIADQGLHVHAPSVQGVVAVSIGSPGSGQTAGAYNTTATGGGGSGAKAWFFIDTGAMPNPGEIDQGTPSFPYGPKITATGSGYTTLPTFPVSAGGTPGVLTPILGDVATPYVFSGYGYQNTDTVVITDPTGSGGSGATGTLTVDSAGRITSFTINTPGSGYGAANVSISTTTGFGGSLVLYVTQNERDVNGNLLGTGPVTGWDLGGNMSFAAGRQYVVALQNSKTGHTSNYFASDLLTGPKSGQGLDALTAVTAVYPIVSSTNATAGFTGYGVGISVPTTGLDPQVDTVLLLAGADGQGVSTVYEVAKIALSLFTDYPGSGALFKQYLYLDTLPDTFNDFNTTGNTLLGSNIWSQQDSAGNINGIALNTPPPAICNHFTLHQGRMFATDGKTVFFSKSLDEVTTSTGLITSKWEECWPGDYQLPIALNNETILGLKSDGTNLHAGTDRSIFTIYGSDPSNFSVPSQAFAQTGILTQDCWSVIYAEGQPSGFVWITQDFKVMHSDFSTYREIGTQLYPVISLLDPSELSLAKVTSLTQGPYNFVILSFSTVGGNPQTDYWIWESRLQKWYHWQIPVTENSSTHHAYSCFVYQYPTNNQALPSGVNNGQKFLFYWHGEVGNIGLRYFDPARTDDLVDSVLPIPWIVQTSWQDLGDPTAIKVINEMDIVGANSPYTVAILGANSESQFESNVVVASGHSVTGPISALATNKFYAAGQKTASKYFSFIIQPDAQNTAANVLTAFTVESYPIARI